MVDRLPFPILFSFFFFFKNLFANLAILHSFLFILKKNYYYFSFLALFPLFTI
uniref:Uncharacterized protein n=1 Tax=Arundo donax TaxID=35708 RepID=A0A0A8YVV8_ARUDO